MPHPGSDYQKFQYAYEDSPICIADGTPPPPFDKFSFTPSARPGARAPHAWLEDGRSILDLFGTGFTLLRLGPEPPDAQGWIRAARQRNVPMTEIAIADRAVAELYGAGLVLVRPDGHVAWRGNACPDEPMAAIDRICGDLCALLAGEKR